MGEQRERLIAAGLGGLVVLGLIIYGVIRLLTPAVVVGPGPSPPVSEEPSMLFAGVDPQKAPFAVRDAAARLRTSRVGYPILTDEGTFLVISMGENGPRAVLTGVEAEPADSTPARVHLALTSGAQGERLLILHGPLTTHAAYRFDLDTLEAGLPTLHNPHKLELTHLDEVAGFALLTPAEGAVQAGREMLLEGYARVFGGRFSVMIVGEDGKMLAMGSGKAAAGYPHWGSFSMQVTLEADSLPESATVILTDPMTGARLSLPLHFKLRAQLG